MIDSYKIFFIYPQKKILIYEETEEDQMENEIYDFIEKLGAFRFLSVQRVISADDFETKIDKRTVANNVILIC